MKTTYYLALFAALGFAGCAQEKSAPQAQREADAEAAEHQADDTGRNSRDREGNNLTPFDQSTSESDVAITRQVRESIADDENMSFSARNVKVITQDGVVTLRGPVENSAEKSAVEQKAKTTPGVARVESELETVIR